MALAHKTKNRQISQKRVTLMGVMRGMMVRLRLARTAACMTNESPKIHYCKRLIVPAPESPPAPAKAHSHQDVQWGAPPVPAAAPAVPIPAPSHRCGWAV